MQKLIIKLNLFLFLILLSSCSNGTDTSQTTETVNECEKILPLFTEKIASPSKSDRIIGWQLMLDYPSCFLAGDFDAAKAEIEALKR